MMTQNEYWDQVAPQKEFTTPFHEAEFGSFLTKQAKILDVGCGYGRTLNELYQKGYRDLIGIDFSAKMISRGRRQFPQLDLRTMNEGLIEFGDGYFDAVILFAVLTCIEDNSEQERLVAEIERVLKPGGILYVNDFLLNTDERNIIRYQEYQAEHNAAFGVFSLPEGAVVRHHDEAWILRLLSPFRSQVYEHMRFTTMNGHISNGFYFIGKK